MNEVNKENVKGLWTVSSSASQDTSLKVRAKARLESRALPTNNSYDEYMVERTSCWILEEVNGDFYCDCREGSKGKFCKHSIGMLYVTGGLVAEPDVRSVPLGNKRKRGRPKKNPHCLVTSPEKSTSVDENLVTAGLQNQKPPKRRKRSAAAPEGRGRGRTLKEPHQL